MGGRQPSTLSSPSSSATCSWRACASAVSGCMLRAHNVISQLVGIGACSPRGLANLCAQAWAQVFCQKTAHSRAAQFICETLFRRRRSRRVEWRVSAFGAITQQTPARKVLAARLGGNKLSTARNVNLAAGGFAANDARTLE